MFLVGCVTRLGTYNERASRVGVCVGMTSRRLGNLVSPPRCSSQTDAASATTVKGREMRSRIDRPAGGRIHEHWEGPLSDGNRPYRPASAQAAGTPRAGPA